MFMQSSGGLTAADLFQGKDAILSGPAGGVVARGRDREARRLRQGHRLRHGRHLDRRRPTIDGEYERAFETEVAGVRMRAPMMRIHTVAAGGGSILQIRAGPLPRRPAIGRRQSRPRLLPARRPAHRHRRQRHGRQAAARASSRRSSGRPATSRSTPRPSARGFAALAARDRRRPRAGGDRRRLPPHRRREHGERHQEDLGRSAATTSPNMR